MCGVPRRHHTRRHNAPKGDLGCQPLPRVGVACPGVTALAQSVRRVGLLILKVELTARLSSTSTARALARSIASANSTSVCKQSLLSGIASLAAPECPNAVSSVAISMERCDTVSYHSSPVSLQLSLSRVFVLKLRLAVHPRVPPVKAVTSWPGGTSKGACACATLE